MKILVIQLARLGDIYLTWPTLRALHRTHPQAEVHLLVREKFAGAAEGLANVNVRTLPTAGILGDVENGERRLAEWLKPFEQEWDLILDLSFSPVGSYLTDYLAGPNTSVRGYTRHPDGFLAIPDDASAYFYAQVGTDRPNRYHLADIFAMVAQVELASEDWGFNGELKKIELESPYIVMHLGASQSEKRYPLRHFKKLLQQLSHHRVYLIGSQDERKLADDLQSFSHVKSLIGETQLTDLFSIIKNASLLIGGDSAPVHIASHVDTPILNLSFASVNFWETGPTASRSWVMYAEAPEDLDPVAVAKAARALLTRKPAPAGVIAGTGRNFDGPRFIGEEDFSWQLILALYTQSNYPAPLDPATIAVLCRLEEAGALALEQLDVLQKNVGSKTALEILNTVDQLLVRLAASSPTVAPLIRWFETERLRMPPQALEATFAHTKKLFEDLTVIVRALLQQTGPNLEELQKHGLQRLHAIETEIPACALSFRLYQTAKAEPMLQRLLGHLHFFDNNGLHHLTSTKVGDAIADWHQAYDDYREVLRQLVQAFQKQDYVFVADLIEYEMSSCVSRFRSQLVKFDPVMLR